MCIWRLGVLFLGKADCNCFPRVGFFFFSKFRVGVGKTGLSGLAPSPLVLELLGAGRTAGGRICNSF